MAAYAMIPHQQLTTEPDSAFAEACAHAGALSARSDTRARPGKLRPRRHRPLAFHRAIRGSASRGVRLPGPLRDRLVAAIVAGAKTTTSGLVADYEHENEPLPRPGLR
jgi:hypothetical protein